MKLALSVSLVACAGLASGADAGISVTEGLTDAQILALTDGLVVWEAEGRFGDRGGAAERELGVGFSTAQPQADEAQVDWANNFSPPAGYTGYAYTVTWDGVDTLTLDVTGIDAGGAPVDETLVYNLPNPQTVTDLYLRAAGNDDIVSSISYDLMGESGTVVGGLGDPHVDTIRISGDMLTGGFTLDGVFTFGWLNEQGTGNSRPSWQIKAAVPAPGAMAILIGAAGLASRRRR